MARAKPKTAVAPKKRLPLTPEAVTEVAVELADAGGLEAVSMRRVASALGVEAMSLYNHVANKDQLFVHMVERIWSRVYVPNEHGDCWSEVRLRYLSAHTVVLEHAWVATLLESCRSGPSLLGASNAVLGCLRRAGLPVHSAYRALLTLDAYLYGFAFQEVTWPHSRSELPDVVTQMLPDVSAQQFPHLVEMMNYVIRANAATPAPGLLAYRVEFEFGLDLILDGLRAAASSSVPVRPRSKREHQS